MPSTQLLTLVALLPTAENQTAGAVLSLKRPTPAFGFVEYGDPESVLRALEAVNGVVLKGKNGQEKPLLIKADEKTRARLDEYEQSRVKDDVSRDNHKLAMPCSCPCHSPPPSTSSKQRTTFKKLSSE